VSARGPLGPRRPGGGARPRGPGPGPFAVVSGFAGRRTVIPFALLVLALLTGGLVVLLLLNTALDRGAFELQAAQRRQTDLTDQQQQYQQQLAALSAPGALASAAAQLGMVPDPRPVFLNPTTGAVLGVPTPAPTPSPVPTPTPTAAASPSAGASPASTAPATAPGAPSATPSVGRSDPPITEVAPRGPAAPSAGATAPAAPAAAGGQ
jgi:hypothetical protein